MRNVLLCATLLLTSIAFAQAPPSLAGQWAIHTNVAGNEGDEQCKFVQTGDQLTGNCKIEGKDHAIAGSVDGNKATWQYETEYEGSPLTVIFRATLVAPGKFDGSISVPAYDAAGDFTATPAPTETKKASE